MANTYDLNLLTALDALLSTGSVTAAAARMHLSTPAMSHTLARIRESFGDPILVRASVWLIAGVLRFMRAAAAVTLPVESSASSAVSRFRSYVFAMRNHMFNTLHCTKRLPLPTLVPLPLDRSVP